MTWLYFLKKNSEVFERFQEFKDLLVNYSNKNIKVLSTDNDGELCSKEFDQFCK